MKYGPIWPQSFASYFSIQFRLIEMISKNLVCLVIGFATRSDLLLILRQIHRTFYVKSHKIPIFYNILKVLVSMIFLLRSCAIFVGEMFVIVHERILSILRRQQSNDIQLWTFNTYAGKHRTEARLAKRCLVMHTQLVFILHWLECRAYRANCKQSIQTNKELGRKFIVCTR